MKLTPDAEVEEVVEDSYRPGVSIVKASAPVEDEEYFQDADEYVFTTRSRWARNFREAGIVPRAADYNPVDHAMRNDLDDPILEVDDNEVRAALFVRDLCTARGEEPVNEFEITTGDEIGRFGAYNREEVGIDPSHYTGDIKGEKMDAERYGLDVESLDYDEIVDAALQPDISRISDNKGLNTMRNVGVASLADKLLEPADMTSKERILHADLSELVEEVDERPEKVGPGNYLAVTEEPVTVDSFYTVLRKPMTGGHHLNSRIGDPEWKEPMVVEFSYDPIRGDTEDIDVEEAFDFPFRLQANFIKKT